MIREEWTTQLIIDATDRKGEFSFRGFHGTYEVTATDDRGNSRTFTIRVEKGSENNWDLKL